MSGLSRSVQKLELKGSYSCKHTLVSFGLCCFVVVAMGPCALRRMNAEDREQEKVSAFVRYAITSDLVKLREMITKRKMNPNAKDRFGMTAIHWASYVGALECIKVLINAGGLPSTTDSNGRNALHHACRKDHDEVVRYLVTNAKVDINSRSENQDTPLHKAVRGKSIKVMEALLKLGADPNLRNEQNRTPLEELEATMPAPTIESKESNCVTSARLTSRPEVYREPIPVRPEPKLVLQPIQRGSCSTERTESVTDVRDFMSRRSVTEFSDHCDHHTAGRSSVSYEPGQWATTSVPRPAVNVPRVPLDQSTPIRKNLRYAGKRVIMAIRVKSALADTEKLELMRLMLQKHLSAPI